MVIDTEARRFQNLMSHVKSFWNILVGMVISPTSGYTVTLFLECYANVVFTGDEGGFEPWAGHLVGEHLALSTLGIQCLPPSSGTITSIMRGNTFLRHFGYADIWPWVSVSVSAIWW